MRRAVIVAFAAAIVTIQSAHAAHWSVDYARSRVGFAVQWSNEPFAAVFKRWNADIDFDPDDLAQSHAAVMIDLASEASDEPDFDSGLKGAQGFQTSQFPAARFVTTSFARKGASAYVAQGTLTLRGNARGITLPFTLVTSGHTAHMIGTAHVLRTDFGLGRREWSAATPVSHDVSITIDVIATARR